MATSLLPHADCCETRLTMKMPRRRLDGCACTSPLAHFYIYHSDSSIRELHPFTTITHLASENVATAAEEDDLTIQFLFRKRSKQAKAAEPVIVEVKGFWATLRTLIAPKSKGKAQWTEKLAGQADWDGEFAQSQLAASTPAADKSRQVSINSLGADHSFPIIGVSLRLEGPYFTPADPARYRTVICLVAGTGVSGAIAIANAFRETERQRSEKEDPDCGGPVGGACKMSAGEHAIWQRCITLWSVREEDYIEMPWLKGTSTPVFLSPVVLAANRDDRESSLGARSADTFDWARTATARFRCCAPSNPQGIAWWLDLGLPIRPKQLHHDWRDGVQRSRRRLVWC